MGKTYTIKLNKETKDFYRNVFLACRLQAWVQEYRALDSVITGYDLSGLSNEEIIMKLSDKEVAKSHLSAAAFEDYLKYYDDIYVRG